MARSLGLGAALLFCTAFGFDRAYAADFWMVGSDQDNTEVDFIDADTIQDTGETIRYWTLTVSVDQKPYVYGKGLVEVICATSQARMLVDSSFNAEGKSIGIREYPEYTAYKYIIPGTLADSEKLMVCSPRATWDPSRRTGSLAEDVLVRSAVSVLMSKQQAAGAAAPTPASRSTPPSSDRNVPRYYRPGAR